MNKFLIRVNFFIIGLVLLSCSNTTTQPSFYYWRTKVHFSEKEKEALKELRVNTLYVRFFDVDLSDDTHQPVPFGVVDSLNVLPVDLSIIPVVYITNRTFLKLKEAAVVTLAEQVVHKVNGLRKNYSELQIDCDWSEKTKQQYFNFLKKVKELCPAHTKLTATIRLHQVKYPLKTGIPPVDGGMLMFYNMGNLRKYDGSNSIFDAEIARKYTSYIKGYILHLDVALPIFRWYVHYRNGNIQGLITKKQLPDVSDTNYFKVNENKISYTVVHPQLLNGIYYKKDDLLKFEALNDEELADAAKLLQENLVPESRRIVLYDLDELNINYYEKETLKKVLATFN